MKNEEVRKMSFSGSRTNKSEWSVDVEGRLPMGRVSEDAAVTLLEILESFNPPCYPAVSVDGESETLGVTLHVDTDFIEEATNVGLSLFKRATKKAFGNGIEVLSVAARTIEEADRKFSEPQKYLDLVGIAEIAAILGVTKQRASELSKSSSFPAPIAALASGRVWLRSSIGHFLEEWKRKPGRPAKRKVSEDEVPNVNQFRDYRTASMEKGSHKSRISPAFGENPYEIWPIMLLNIDLPDDCISVLEAVREPLQEQLEAYKNLLIAQLSYSEGALEHFRQVLKQNRKLPIGEYDFLTVDGVIEELDRLKVDDLIR